MPKGSYGDLSMRPFLFIALLILSSCGLRTSVVDYGKTSVSALIEEKGPPQSVEILPVKNSTMLIYEHEKYQAQAQIVTAGFRNPIGAQKTLLYWKHQFKKCETQTRKSNNDEFEFACPAEGITVIYADGSEFISRVVEYEKK